MESKLYVGNLSYSTTEQSLHQMFSQFGTVNSCSLIVDKETGRSKGFAFVEMSNPEEASTAIAELSGQEAEGRKLTVSLARPKTNRPSFERGRSNFNSDRQKSFRSY